MLKKLIYCLALFFSLISFNGVNAETGTQSDMSLIFEMNLAKKKWSNAQEFQNYDYDDFFTVVIENTGDYPIRYRLWNESRYSEKIYHYGQGKVPKGTVKTFKNIQFNSQGSEKYRVLAQLRSERDDGCFRFLWFKKGAEGNIKVYRQKGKIE